MDFSILVFIILNNKRQGKPCIKLNHQSVEPLKILLAEFFLFFDHGHRELHLPIPILALESCQFQQPVFFLISHFFPHILIFAK